MGLMKKALRSQRGFSLIELMTVVAIIGILSAIAILNYQKYMRCSKQTEAKLLLSALYASNISFNVEWGYSTSNFIQMGFAPQGDINYRTGFNALETIDPGNWIQDNTLPTNISDYDGPPVPKTPSNSNIMIDTKNFCESTIYGADCLCLRTSTITLPTNAKINNSTKYNPKFKAMAIGNLAVLKMMSGSLMSMEVVKHSQMTEADFNA